MPNTTPSANPSAPQGEQDIVFGEDLEDHSWKAMIFQPLTLAVAAVVVGGLLVWAYLEQNSVDRTLPVPEISYALQRNEGVTTGVPVAIKMNQITVFLIDDPMEGGAGAERAKQIVSHLETTVAMLQTQPGRTVTLDIDRELPEIVISKPDGTERRSIVELLPGDLTLVGETDGKRVARVWAERLTDAIKVCVFGEPPKFSKGTEFGDSLDALYATALEQGGAISKGSLDSAYALLDDRQKQALETLPIFRPDEPIELLQQ
ncbi:MAG: hypothetical protein WD733_06100 [Bryobacterales bacterium]